MLFRRTLKKFLRRLGAELSMGAAPLRQTYIGRDLVLAETKWGGHVVVPGYNIDVGVGIIRDGIHEPWTTRLVQELLREEGTYVNVGANFGYYVSLGGRIVGAKGRVIAVEANPTVFSILQKTIFFAGIPDRVIAYNRAAHRLSGMSVTFTFDYQFIGGGHIGRDTDQTATQTKTPFWNRDSLPELIDETGKWVAGRGLYNFFEIKTIALDDILEGELVDLIHCDVEHAEPYVILGAKALISRSLACKIIFEWSNYAYKTGTDDYRLVVQEFWSFLEGENFVVRHLVPTLGSDGGLSLSAILSYEEFLMGEHGDYVAVRRNSDPWA